MLKLVLDISIDFSSVNANELHKTILRFPNDFTRFFWKFFYWKSVSFFKKKIIKNEESSERSMNLWIYEMCWKMLSIIYFVSLLLRIDSDTENEQRAWTQTKNWNTSPDFNNALFGSKETSYLILNVVQHDSPVVQHDSPVDHTERGHLSAVARVYKKTNYSKW